MKTKPSDFAKFPFGSVMRKTEAEIVAQNIMTILKRTGDVFRELTEDEYEQERLKDGKFTPNEYGYFREVIGHCKSADTAKLFSSAWAD